MYRPSSPIILSPLGEGCVLQVGGAVSSDPSRIWVCGSQIIQTQLLCVFGDTSLCSWCLQVSSVICAWHSLEVTIWVSFNWVKAVPACMQSKEGRTQREGNFPGNPRGSASPSPRICVETRAELEVLWLGEGGVIRSRTCLRAGGLHLGSYPNDN